jgi:hypothetical protein
MLLEDAKRLGRRVMLDHERKKKRHETLVKASRLAGARENVERLTSVARLLHERAPSAPVGRLVPVAHHHGQEGPLGLHVAERGAEREHEVAARPGRCDAVGLLHAGERLTVAFELVQRIGRQRHHLRRLGAFGRRARHALHFNPGVHVSGHGLKPPALITQLGGELQKSRPLLGRRLELEKHERRTVGRLMATRRDAPTKHQVGGHRALGGGALRPALRKGLDQHARCPKPLGVAFPDGLQLHVGRTVLLKGARPDGRGREHAGKNRNGRKGSDGLQGRTRNQLHHFSSS